MYKSGMTIAEVLAECIARRGLTQEAAAVELGVKQATVNRWLSGQHTPALDRAPLLARFCQITDRQAETAILLQQKRGANSLPVRVANLEAQVSELQAELAEQSALLRRLLRKARG